MKLNVKKIIFGVVFLCAVLGVCVWRMPLSIQTNLNSLIETNDEAWPIQKLTNKFSDVVNIVIESGNMNAARRAATDITKTLSGDEFRDASVINTNFSAHDVIDLFKSHKNSYLSVQYRNILQHGDGTEITNNAVATVSESMAPNILSLQDDPFLLLTNYVGGLKSVAGKWGMRDGFLWQYVAPNHYILISVDISHQDTNKMMDTVKSINRVVQKYNNENTHVFLSGVPIHTVNMTQTSKLQLSFFSLIALAAAILLNWLLFRKTTTLIPVGISLIAGFVAGATGLFLCFPTPHILTFVFGVTLIGMGIDYSFHFISAKNFPDRTNIHKNIFHSFLTTIVCFLPLAASGITILQQIAVFTITGLAAIYFGWLIFMPGDIHVKNRPIKMPRAVPGKYRPVIIGTLIAAILITIPWMKTQNNMSQLYRPNPELLSAEYLMQKLNGGSASEFLLVRGKTLDEAIRVSEKIRDEHGDFFDISTIVPSTNRQIENQNLIQKLYKSQSRKIRRELGLRATPKFAQTPPVQITDVTQNKTLENLVNNFIFDDGKYVYLVARVNGDFSINTPYAITVSPAQQMTDLMEAYSHKSYRLLAVCGIGLLVLLFALYGKRALIYLAPSILAVGLTASVLTWFFGPISFFHLLSLFIVIGLTLDYSIFHINAIDNREIRPVLFSCATSLVGFGILGFASFLLIRSMGITLGIGLAFGYIISLFLFRRQN